MSVYTARMRTKHCSTGTPAIDEAIDGLYAGDNVVFRFSEISAYREACEAFAEETKRDRTPIHYFRFARHEPLLDSDTAVVHETDPERGFERFISEIHSVIRSEGLYGNYVFDVLSALSATYFSDRMIGNLFRVTCPFLRRLRTLAFFGIERYNHSYHAVDLIRQTTQVLIDQYEVAGTRYVLPIKLEGRSDRSLLRLRSINGDRATAVADSTTISRVISGDHWPGLPSASYRMIGIWDRTFMRAEEEAARSSVDGRGMPEPLQPRTAPADGWGVEGARKRDSQETSIFDETLFLLTGARGRMKELLSRYLTLDDIIRVWKRVIGTGMIGGKATGMLAAHAILRASGPKWTSLLEEHDSFYIGSDVFYSYLVENDCWWFRQLQKDPSHYLDRNEQIRDRLLDGEFPEYITRRIEDMLDYFGPEPIIVRSSSLLEDAFGSAFAGKYDSIFCPNQGTREERLARFLSAARWIYAGTMSREALEYRKSRGILERDEQMALLVQRVSGSHHGRWYMPHIAGVGFSFNPYSWSREIDPESGVLRLVLGLGTRAVDRSDDDVARVVALNAPTLRPEGGPEEQRRYTQRRADALNLDLNTLESPSIDELLDDAPGLPRDLLTVRDRERVAADREAATRARRSSRRPKANPAASSSASGASRAEHAARPGGSDPRLPSFDPLFARTPFAADMRELLSTLETAYATAVDVEFTATLTGVADQDPADTVAGDGGYPVLPPYSINVVQCRPLQVKGRSTESVPLPGSALENRFIESRGGVIGHSREFEVDRIVIVRPDRYSRLPDSARFEVARELSHLLGRKAGSLAETAQGSHEFTLLIGPGRWGTSTPSLGVPARFSDIAEASAIMEVDVMHDALVPDLSLGTHVFHEMVELDLLYIAHFTGQEGNRLVFEELYALPGEERHGSGGDEMGAERTSAAPGGTGAGAGGSTSESCISVFRPARSGRRLILNANTQDQRCIIYWADR